MVTSGRTTRLAPPHVSPVRSPCSADEIHQILEIYILLLKKGLLGALTLAILLTAVSVALAAHIRGTNGPDVITGTPRADNIDGLGAADRIPGLGGKDKTHGGDGDDSIDGDG